MKFFVFRFGITILLAVGIIGCTKNIDHISDYVYCPENYTFLASYNKTWDSAIEALLELTAIDTMDQKSGYISTAITTVDGRKMDFVEHAILGQTYKFTYDIRIRSLGKQRAQISTKVKLYLEQFMGISRREDSVIQVEHYLREKLYTAICSKLFPEGSGHCSNGFFDQPPEYYQKINEEQIPKSPQPAQPSIQFDTKVKKAQEVLSEIGYTPGPADGLMGKKTKKSLEEFQQNKGLPVTGTLDNNTYDSLMSNAHLEQQSSSSSGSITVPDKIIIENEAQNTPVKKSSPNKTSPSSSKVKGRIITSESADLLQEEDLFGAEIIMVIPTKTILKVISQSGDYYKVRYKGKEGYIHHEFVIKK